MSTYTPIENCYTPLTGSRPKSPRQSVNKHSNWVKLKGGNQGEVLSFSNKKILSTYHNSFLQESKVVRQRELVAHGFTQRPRNIPSRYMWELRSYIQLLADQLNLINLDLYVPWGLCELNPNKKSQYIIMHKSLYDLR